MFFQKIKVSVGFELKTYRCIFTILTKCAMLLGNYFGREKYFNLHKYFILLFISKGGTS